MTHYLDAHTQSPHRAEPLYDLALHYGELGEHALALLFARRGADLPFPTRDTLFVEAEVYAWKMADALASSAYWMGELEMGEAAARKALRHRPDDARLRKNLDFYLARKTQSKKRPVR